MNDKAVMLRPRANPDEESAFGTVHKLLESLELLARENPFLNRELRISRGDQTFNTTLQEGLGLAAGGSYRLCWIGYGWLIETLPGFCCPGNFYARPTAQEILCWRLAISPAEQAPAILTDIAASAAKLMDEYQEELENARIKAQDDSQRLAMSYAEFNMTIGSLGESAGMLVNTAMEIRAICEEAH